MGLLVARTMPPRIKLPLLLLSNIANQTNAWTSGKTQSCHLSECLPDEIDEMVLVLDRTVGYSEKELGIA